MSQFSLYTVYDNRTDEPIMIDGTAEECAERMGIKTKSFYALYWHCKKGDRTRWAIIKSEQHTNLSVKTFGDKVRYHRLMKGLSIKDLSDASGISMVTISQYENNKYDPKLFIAVCLADALGLSLDYLAGRKGYV